MTENLGGFFKSISKVKMDLDTFADFLERLRKDELTVERVEPRRWKAKWWGLEGCWIVALPISECELTVDFFFFSWDQDTRAAFRWPEVQGKYYKVLDLDKPPTLEQVTNLWPQRVFDTIEAGLQEVGVLQGETPAEGGVADRPWEKIPNEGYNRRMVELWHIGYTSPEIGQKLSRAPKTILNRLSDLRKIYGEEIVPRRREKRKAQIRIK